MSPDSLRKRINATPFQPSGIHMADGWTLDVPHPEFISLTRSGRSVIVTNPDRDENWEIVDVSLIRSAGAKKRRLRSKT